MAKKASTLEKSVSAKPKIKLKSAVRARPDEQTPTVTFVSEEAIRIRARQKWEAAGKPEGDDLRLWLAAEQEILQSN